MSDNPYKQSLDAARAQVIKCIQRALDGERMRVTRFDVHEDSLDVTVWPDETCEGEPLKFSVSVKQYLT